jgi:hypothetical protein
MRYGIAVPASADPGASRPHIFLSYAAEDRDAARRLAEALTAEGQVVWWDRLIAGGALWGQAIDRALASAWAVIVLWTPASTRSDYVRAEARHAADRGLLVPARLEACEPPMPFGEYQTIDLTGWSADPSSGTPRELIGALQHIRDGAGIDHAGPSAPRGSPAVGRLLGYWTDLFQLATAPKAFLIAKWDEPERVVNAARFYAATAALRLFIGVPLVLKLGGAIGWEIFGAFVYGPLRMLALGAVVHLAFRAVGGAARAVGTLTAFAYLHSLQMLVFECTQGVAVGLLRLMAPEVAERIFAAVNSGDASAAMVQTVQEQGLGPSAAFLALVWWPLFVVPFIGWGAFRIRHEVSRWRSAAAAILAVVLGMIAYAATILLSFTNAGPG